MPEFKNYVSYSGNREQLERYAAELTKAGFTIGSGLHPLDKDANFIISYEDGEFGYYNHFGSGEPFIFGPDQFAEALKAATEPA